ncbi:MAG: ribonuclease R [Clostridiaceae bacterium]|nr:ribonuclease R [Clostridiaceae bacterium]
MSNYESKKKKLIELLTDKKTPPLKFADIVLMLDVKPSEKDLLQKMLDEAVQEGILKVNKRGVYRPVKRETNLKGIYLATKGEFGFIRPENEEENDFFVPPGKNKGAMDGDTVLYKRNGGDTAEVIGILSHAIASFTGVVHNLHGYGRKYVVPVLNKIKGFFLITEEDAVKVVRNDLVKVEIVKYTKEYTEVRVVEKLGKANDPKNIVESILKDFNVTREFPTQVKTQVKTMFSDPINFEDDARSDFRRLLTVTIDGSDAKDLDDAISLEKTEDGNFRLYVHIADVSEYVTRGTPLDKEAFRRGTSIYFPDDVVPMLPKELSNGICSLNPNEDRLAMTVVMDIDKTGRVLDHDVLESVICSDARLTYDYVQELIDNGFPGMEEDPKIAMLKDMYELYKILKEKRNQRGAINFDFPETKVILGEDGYPIDILPYKTGESNGVIEEFMLICNETIAQHFGVMEIPFVFRIHEFPDPVDIRNLAAFASLLGFKLKNINNIRPAALAQLVDEASGTDYEEMLHTAVLRSMKKAVYSPLNVGHFGLASDYYCHFTSPIRRYPDLLIHRIIKSILRGTMDYMNIEPLKEYVEKAASRSSDAEREADDLEREIVDYYKCLYMSKKIGEEFDAIISDINSAGLRVRLRNTVTGIIFFRNLSDYYNVDEKTMTATGELSKKKFQVGDKIKVTVWNVDVQTRLIEFMTSERKTSEMSEEEIMEEYFS